MITQPRVNLLTAEEFSALPDDGNHYDLVGGELIKVGRPKPEHGELQATLTYFVVGHVRLNALGKVYTEAGFHITQDPDTVYGPDVAFVAKNRATEAMIAVILPLHLIWRLKSSRPTIQSVARWIRRTIIFPQARGWSGLFTPGARWCMSAVPPPQLRLSALRVYWTVVMCCLTFRSRCGNFSKEWMTNP